MNLSELHCFIYSVNNLPTYRQDVRGKFKVNKVSLIEHTYFVNIMTLEQSGSHFQIVWKNK